MNASPKSLVSVNAVPPVSDASVVQRLLLRGELGELVGHAAAGERAHAAAAGLAGAAARHDRLQAARVDRVDRDVGPHRGVHRGAQLDLVVGAAPLHAGAEVDDRLLLLNRLQRFGQRLQRAQPHVVVEGVELLRARVDGRGVVGGGGGRFVGRRGAGIDGRERRALRRRERGQHGANRLLAAGEVGEDLETRADRRHRHQIGRRHLSSTHLIAASAAFCTSSGCIELVSNSSVSSRWPATSSDVRGAAGVSSGGLAAVVAAAAAAGAGRRRCGQRRAAGDRRRVRRDLLERERDDLLPNAVLDQLEIVGW